MIIFIILSVLILKILLWYAKCAIVYRSEQKYEEHPLFTFKQLKKFVISGNITVSNWNGDETICFKETNSKNYYWIGTHSYFDFLRLFALYEIQTNKKNKLVEKKDVQKEEILRKMQGALKQNNENS